MAKLPRAKITGEGNKHYWCRPGNHSCYKLDLVVQFGDSCFGICRACVRKKTQGKDIPTYWQEDSTSDHVDNPLDRKSEPT